MDPGQSIDKHKEWARNFKYTFYEKDGGRARLARLRKRGRTDWDVLKENHRFLRPDADPTVGVEEGAEESSHRDDAELLSKYSYEELTALKYYNKLYKEYAVIDLKHYKSGRVALRWRTEDELVEGIGQFTCGGIRCEYHQILPDDGRNVDLTAYQLDFAYLEPVDENSETSTVKKPSRPVTVQKQALVKVILCKRCAKKMNWKREQDRKEEEKSRDDSNRDSRHRKHSREHESKSSRSRRSRSRSPSRRQDIKR